MKPRFQNPAPVRRLLRAARAVARFSGPWLVALVLLGGTGSSDGASVRAEDSDPATAPTEEPFSATIRTGELDRPWFVFQAPGNVMPVQVHDIVSTEVTDLVMIPAGYHSGYRPGMICHVRRGETEIAEIMMVEVRNEVSAGIIVNLFTDEVIERGDVVRVKTTQYQR